MMTKHYLILLTFLFTIKAFATEPGCESCHAEQVTDWQTSHHANAMAEATEQNVLGDFNNQSIQLGDSTARFYKESGVYKVSLEQSGKLTEYDIKYTFGFEPLQQYLIETTNGRLQVFPFTWDNREQPEGGQRWYHIYNENVASESRIHWQQPLQSWNGMCADCHSSGLTRNFDVTTNTFQTIFTEINVGCASCHVMADDHAEQAKAVKSNVQSKDKIISRSWQFSKEANFAKLVGDKNNLQEMNTCFACHSLREPLTDGINPEHAFLDQFAPIFISPTHYHADGQIKEEVYVYGSFLQSKMFQAGVQCSDCHNNHSNELKIEGNGLCLQCHKVDVYQTNDHLRHEINSEAAQCVTCHMPDETYMGVDDRRDHKFVIPRPELTERFNIPNACADCHAEQGNKWAAAKIKEWYKPEYPITSVALDFMTLMYEGSLPYSKHVALINSAELSPFKRASALAMLPNSTNFIDYDTAEAWTKSDDPLIRLAIAKVAHLFTQFDRAALLTTLLSDQYKAIRTTAVEHLIPSNNITSELKTALEELMAKNAVNSWRGEGTLNQSMLLLKKGEQKKAIALLKQGIEIDPYFAPSYVNLVDIYRQTSQPELEKQILELATGRINDSAILEYSYALHLVRNKNYADAKSRFQRATELEPNNTNYALAYLLILEALNQTDEALAWISLNNQRFRSSREIQAVIARLMKNRNR